MANTKSAQKSHEQSLRKRVFNLRRKRAMKSSIKELMDLVGDKKKKDAEALMPEVHKAIDKAAKGGILKKNTASRTKSRLSKRVSSL